MDAAKKISMLIVGLLVAIGLAACAVENEVGRVSQALDGCNGHYYDYWDEEECQSPTHCWEEYVEYEEEDEWSYNDEPVHGWRWETHCDDDYDDTSHTICESYSEHCGDGEDFRYDCGAGGDCYCDCR